MSAHFGGKIARVWWKQDGVEGACRASAFSDACLETLLFARQFAHSRYMSRPANETGAILDKVRDGKLRVALPAALCLIAAHHAWGDTMRCGNGLIVNGDSMATVQALCGPPTIVQQGVKESATTVGGGHGSDSHTVGAAVPVETWTYNRGPNQLLVNIRFVNGKVVQINTLHRYGN